MSAWTVQGPNLRQDEVIHRQLHDDRMPLYIAGHQGMGDHILCSGLYRSLAQHWQINVLCLHRYAFNVRLMVADIPDAAVMGFHRESDLLGWLDQERDCVALRLGFFSGEPFDRWQFDLDFYAHAHVGFTERWSRYVAPKCDQVVVPRGRYVFVHDNPAMGSRIQISGAVRPVPQRSIFEHREMILGAAEIHCASSAFAVFADSHTLNGATLYFHPFGREIPQLRNSWKIVK